ncbi:MAG TPA: hypothetical protein VMI74_01845 [Burkholderiales bacterium]|nr:hypothetical protein [Burkholderiales bacterium]
MQISMGVSVAISIVFAAVCFGVAAYGFGSLGDIADPAQRADGQGFALFWAFLGAVAAAFAVLGYWILRTHKEDGSDPC